VIHSRSSASPRSVDATDHHAVSIVAEEIGYGIVGGLAAGAAAAAVMAIGHRRNLFSRSWLSVIPIAGAALAYGLAAALGGSGFSAAFLPGLNGSSQQCLSGEGTGWNGRMTSSGRLEAGDAAVVAKERAERATERGSPRARQSTLGTC